MTAPIVRRSLLTALALVALCLAAQAAQAAAGGSRCIALARAAPGMHFVALDETATRPGEVRITFVGHATFLIESSGGTVIATDYTGFAGAGPHARCRDHEPRAHRRTTPTFRTRASSMCCAAGPRTACGRSTA